MRLTGAPDYPRFVLPARDIASLIPMTFPGVEGAAEGVRGCTAFRVGRVSSDKTGLYVVTNCGPINPASGGLKPARLVRLETGLRGAPVHYL